MEPLEPGNIGVKMNAERYMFSEPRAPVDAVWARIRGSRFSILKAEAVVNFLVNYAENTPFDQKCILHISAFSAPTMLFARNALLGPKREI